MKNTPNMPLYTLDTLQFSKRLIKAGLKKEIAEELSEAIKDNNSQSIKGLATKADIREIKQEIKNLEGSLRKEIDSLEYKITSKIFVMLLVAIGVMNYLNKIL